MKARAVALIGLLSFSIGLFLGSKMITPTQLSLEEEILAQEVRLRGVQRVLSLMQARLTELKKEQAGCEPQTSGEQAALEAQVAALQQENGVLRARLTDLGGGAP